jgi:hypothetical protein
MISWRGGRREAARSSELAALRGYVGWKISERKDPFASIIRCTANPAKADKRTRSKWIRVMRYAAVHKPDSEALDRFLRRKGGIDAFAARFTRRMGRGPARRAGA